ncbi:hypothetical protein BDW67DRAFT_155351 [Aspergillus spinulosporus]
MGIQRCRLAVKLSDSWVPLAPAGKESVSIAGRIRLLMLLSLTARFASTMAMMLAQFSKTSECFNNRSLSRRILRHLITIALLQTRSFVFPTYTRYSMPWTSLSGQSPPRFSKLNLIRTFSRDFTYKPLLATNYLLHCFLENYLLWCIVPLSLSCLFVGRCILKGFDLWRADGGRNVLLRGIIIWTRKANLLV